MNFAAASGLWLGLIAVPILILYVLKIRRHRRVVPYLALWADLVGERQFTSLFRRLQRWLSLLLQILIATCLVGAFAALTMSDSFLKEESVVVVVDTSASMHGLERIDGTRSRFAAAIDKARDICEGRSAEDEFAIIAAGAQPEVLRGFTRSTLRLREALDRLRLTKAVGDLDGAIAFATNLLRNKQHRRILLISDAAGDRAARLTAANEDLRWIRIGESVPNIAIQRFQVRRNFALNTDYLLLVVANESDEPAEVEIEISIDGQLRKVLPIQLASGEVRSDTRELSLQQGGFAIARVVHRVGGEHSGDGLAVDDVAFAALPTVRLFKIMLVARSEAEEAPFRAAVSALASIVDHESSIAVDPTEFAAMPPGDVAAFDLVIFVNWAPDSLPLTGRYLAINALPGGLPAEQRGVEVGPQLRELDLDHPLNRFLEIKTINPIEARPVDSSGGEVFMSTAGGPVGVVFREPRRSTVYLGLDLLSDLFFLRVSFPVILRNVLGWMHEEESLLVEATYRPGEVIHPRFAVAEDAVRIEWIAAAESAAGEPLRRDCEVKVTDGRFYFGETAEPGRYWIHVGDTQYRTVVNLFDAGESDLRMPADNVAVDVEVEHAGFLFGRDLWPLLMLAAAGLWLCEWGLFHRRLTE